MKPLLVAVTAAWLFAGPGIPAADAAEVQSHCVFRLAITIADAAERGLADETVDTVIRRYVEVLKDDSVFTGGGRKSSSSKRARSRAACPQASSSPRTAPAAWR